MKRAYRAKRQAFNKNEKSGRKDYAPKIKLKDSTRVKETLESSRAQIANTGYVTRNLTNNKSVPNYSRLNSGQFEYAERQSGGNKAEYLLLLDKTYANSQLSQFKQRSFDNQQLSTAEKALRKKKLHKIRTAQDNLVANQSIKSKNLEQNTTSIRTAPRRQVTPRKQIAHQAPPNVRHQTAAASSRNSYTQRITLHKTNKVPNNKQSSAEVPFNPKKTYDRSHLSQKESLATLSHDLLDDYARKGQLLTANWHRQISYRPIDFTENCSPSTKQRSIIMEAALNPPESKPYRAKSEIRQNESMLPSSQQFPTHDGSQTTRPGCTLRSGLNANEQKAAISASNSVHKTNRKPKNEQSSAEVPFHPKKTYDRSHLSQNESWAILSRDLLDDYARKGQLLTANWHRQISYRPIDFTENRSRSTKQRSATNEAALNPPDSKPRRAKSEIKQNASMLPSSQQFSTAAPSKTSIDIDQMLEQTKSFLDRIEFESKRFYSTIDDAEQHYRLEQDIKYTDSRLVKSEKTQRNKELHFPQTKVKNIPANAARHQAYGLKASQSLHNLQFSESTTCTRNLTAKSTAKHVTWFDQPKPKASICNYDHLQIPKNSAYDNDYSSTTSANSSYLDFEDALRSQTFEIPTRPTNTADAHKLSENVKESENSYSRALMTAVFKADPVTYAKLDLVSLDGSSESELELPGYTNSPCMLPIYTALVNKFANIHY